MTIITLRGLNFHELLGDVVTGSCMRERALTVIVDKVNVAWNIDVLQSVAMCGLRNWDII